MIAASPGTAKAEEAFRRGGVHVVFPAWLNESIYQWVRQGEDAYRVPRSERLASLDQGALDELATSIHTNPEEADAAGIDELANMDWGEAEDEVEAFLDGEDDDETASEASHAAPSELSESFHSDAAPEASRDDAPDAPGGTSADLLRSPLSRRRQAAALRGGQSKLRQSVVPDEEQESGSDESPAPTPKRRRTRDPVAALRSQGGTPPDSEEEHFLDDLALDMERELGDDL